MDKELKYFYEKLKFIFKIDYFILFLMGKWGIRIPSRFKINGKQVGMGSTKLKREQPPALQIIKKHQTNFDLNSLTVDNTYNF